MPPLDRPGRFKHSWFQRIAVDYRLLFYKLFVWVFDGFRGIHYHLEQEVQSASVLDARVVLPPHRYVIIQSEQFLFPVQITYFEPAGMAANDL